MDAKKKGLAALIVSGAAPKREMEQEGDEVEGLDVAAEDIMRALDERDPEMLKSALKAFIDHCY